VPTGSLGRDGKGTRRIWMNPPQRMVMLVPAGAAARLHRDVEGAAITALSGRHQARRIQVRTRSSLPTA